MASRAVTPEEKKFLCYHGALSMQAPKANVMLVAHAIETLKGLGIKGASLEALEGIPEMQSFTEELQACPPLAIVARPSSRPSTPTDVAGPSQGHLTAPQVLQDLPIVLPDVHIAPKDQRAHYSLPKANRLLEPLASQMTSLKSWCTNSIQLDRDGASVAQRTWTNVCSSIFLYLGFLHFFMKVAQPTLHAYTLAGEFAKYISFRVSKATSIITLAQQVSHAKKVLQFLRLTANVHEALEIQNVVAWMDKLKGQLVSRIPRKRKDPVQMEEEGEWLPSPELVALLDNLRVTVLQGVPQAAGELCNFSSARLLYDACLSSFMFGYLPPLRLACLRTLQVPSVATCLDPECKDKACKGNRVLFKEGGYYISLPHHKNQHRWHSLPLEVQIPLELAELTQCYLEKAHPILCPGLEFMFADKHGKQMQQPSTLTNWWHGLMKRLGSPAAFPPSLLRHIFVDERRSHESAPGPSNQGAAQVMGNSVSQWDKAYDLNQNRRESQAAVNAMPQWRSAMLEQARDKGKGKMVVVEPHGGDSGSSGSYKSC